MLAVQNHDTTKPLIWIVNEKGETRTVAFQISGAIAMRIYDWDMGSDGAIALVGYAGYEKDNKPFGFVALIPAAGWATVMINTKRYRAGQVAITPDGSIWTAGADNSLKDAAVIRRFDSNGKQTGAYIPQSSVSGPPALSNLQNALRASKDRVVWCSTNGRLVEISLEGQMLRDEFIEPPLGEFQIMGLAVADSGEIFLGTSHAAAKGDELEEIMGIYTLSRSSRAWKGVAADVGSVRGVNGKQLVVSGPRCFRFYEVVR